MIIRPQETGTPDRRESTGTTGRVTRRRPMTEENRIKTFRWLFYMNLTQLLIFFAVPIQGFPWSHVLDMVMLASLTVGTIFATFSLIVNIYGLIIDKGRKRLYIVMIALMAGWLTWAAISWLYIEHMDYILR